MALHRRRPGETVAQERARLKRQNVGKSRQGRQISHFAKETKGAKGGTKTGRRVRNIAPGRLRR